MATLTPPARPPRPRPVKWDSWVSGTFRLHLESGTVLVFAGKLRTKTDASGIIDYEAMTNSIEMLPHFDHVIAIERLSR